MIGGVSALEMLKRKRPFRAILRSKLAILGLLICAAVGSHYYCVYFAFFLVALYNLGISLEFLLDGEYDWGYTGWHSSYKVIKGEEAKKMAKLGIFVFAVASVVLAYFSFGEC